VEQRRSQKPPVSLASAALQTSTSEFFAAFASVQLSVHHWRWLCSREHLCSCLVLSIRSMHTELLLEVLFLLLCSMNADLSQQLQRRSEPATARLNDFAAKPGLRKEAGNQGYASVPGTKAELKRWERSGRFGKKVAPSVRNSLCIEPQKFRLEVTHVQLGPVRGLHDAPAADHPLRARIACNRDIEL
jgi:hypothetical protein